MQELFKNVFWTLPHEVRRAAWMLMRTRDYQEAREWRRNGQLAINLVPYDRHRCIFVHVPKVAGTSLGHSLFGYDSVENYQGPGHLTLRRFSLIYSEKEFREYFKFAFVRNPWDRLHSAYTYLKKGGWNPRDEGWAGANLADFPTFESFVRNWLPGADIENSHDHLIPQYRFLRLRGKAPAVDFIGHFETLEEDFDRVKARLGIDGQLARLNQTRRGQTYRDAYTDEMKDIVAQAYADDIRIFGYDFEGLRSAKLTFAASDGAASEEHQELAG